jgi:hypothetical protein
MPMKETLLFSEELWERFVKKTAENRESFELKTYPHLDPYFNFLKNSSDIRKLVSDPELIARHSFLPFVKILTKTPRFRFQENEKSYGLETKIRPISFASHFDSYIYSFYSFAMTERYQDYIRKRGFDSCVLAYRSDLDGKCNIQFAKETFDSVREKIKKKGACTAIALDITGYFDNIDHIILKEKWCKILDLAALPKDQYKVFQSLTRYSYINRDSILKHFKIDLKKKGNWNSMLDLIPDILAGSKFKEKFDLLRKRNLLTVNKPKVSLSGKKSFRGIPQGSPMSAVLSNIYLIDFDEKIFKLSSELGFIYRRYCDDILIICDTEKNSLINEIIIKEILEYELVIQPKKTEIIDFRKTVSGKMRGFNQKKTSGIATVINDKNEKLYYKNLQYLGFEFNGESIYIRPGSLSRYFRKMKGRIIKTIVMSYSDKSQIEKILKRQIFERYSHLGKRNFLSYAMKASKKRYYSKTLKTYREGMDSMSIRRQISAHFAILEKEALTKSNARFKYKEYIYDKKKKEGRRVRKQNLKL